jgi:DNA/RNA endonuclease G (NUC1)
VLGPYRTFQIANAYLEAAISYGFGALKAADPLEKTEVGREVERCGHAVIVPIEDAAEL